jgi:hypothetical protein
MLAYDEVQSPSAAPPAIETINTVHGEAQKSKEIIALQARMRSFISGKGRGSATTCTMTPTSNKGCSGSRSSPLSVIDYDSPKAFTPVASKEENLQTYLNPTSSPVKGSPPSRSTASSVLPTQKAHTSSSPLDKQKQHLDDTPEKTVKLSSNLQMTELLERRLRSVIRERDGFRQSLNSMEDRMLHMEKALMEAQQRLTDAQKIETAERVRFNSIVEERNEALQRVVAAESRAKCAEARSRTHARRALKLDAAVLRLEAELRAVKEGVQKPSSSPLFSSTSLPSGESDAATTQKIYREATIREQKELLENSIRGADAASLKRLSIKYHPDKNIPALTWLYSELQAVINTALDKQK